IADHNVEAALARQEAFENLARLGRDLLHAGRIEARELVVAPRARVRFGRGVHRDDLSGAGPRRAYREGTGVGEEIENAALGSAPGYAVAPEAQIGEEADAERRRHVDCETAPGLFNHHFERGLFAACAGCGIRRSLAGKGT